ncbi:probable glutathione S-transferase 7 [Mercenaria mercenaria]|uniref:probable glutathione S-transferase 7 n=1 Tax=Mercenaria mercenaria TaxID=6596 RepID=UPI001E1DDE58|nr:probable glutathione S-transferase 7 [Mercenaria mercenaria]
MPSYKFSYFDVRGRGELVRYVFYAAGRDFEDDRIQSENWPSFKPSTPFGQMPVLDVDGKKLAQSGAIARYVAREFGLAGKDNWEQGLVDQYMGLVEDMFTELVKGFFEKDEEKKKELQKNMVDVVFPKFLGLFEKALDQNGGKYFVGDALTLADLAVLNGFDTPLKQVPNLMDSFPKLKAHRERVMAIPKLSEYIKNRKQTDI